VVAHAYAADAPATVGRITVVRAQMNRDPMIREPSAETGHATRNGRHYIHSVEATSSLDAAVKDAVGSLTGWSGLQVVGFSAPCSNSGALARA